MATKNKYDIITSSTGNRYNIIPDVPAAPVVSQPVVASTPAPARPQIDSTRPITQSTAFPQATWGDGKPVYANPATVDTKSYVKPPAPVEGPKPYSFSDSIKPLDIKMPQAVTDFLNPLKIDYKKNEEAIKAAGEKQRAAMKPLEDLIRKPLEATFGKAISTGETLGKEAKALPLEILNHPAVQKAMVEVAKRTSGTGVVSMVQAIGPKTFDEAYQANRAAQAGDPSKLHQFFYQLGDTVPQTALGVALNFVPYAGVPLSTSYWTALSAAEQIQNKGSVTSLGNIGIDVIGDRMLGSSIESLFKAPAKTLFKTAVQNFTVEGGTEVAQDLLKMQNDYLNAKTPEEKDKILAQAKEYFTSGQILMTAGVGGLTGAGLGTAAYTVNQTLPQTTVTSDEKGIPVYRGGEIDTNNVPLQGISVATDRTTAENFISPEGGTVSEAYISPTANILKEASIPSNLQTEYITAAKELANPNNFSTQLQTSVRQKQQAIVDYAKNNGFDAVEIPFENEIRIINPKILTKKITESEKSSGPGYQKFAKQVDEMVKNKTFLPEDATILKTLFEGTSDTYLGQLNISENARLKNVLGRFNIKQTGYGQIKPESNQLQMQKGLAGKGSDAARVFAHEFGHAGWYLVLTQEERNLVTQVYKQLGKSGSRALFTAGLEGNVYHHAKNEREFFAESFAEYIMEHKVPPAQLKPLYQRLAVKFFEGIKRLVNRQENAALNRLRPLFERALRGDRTTPLADLMAQEPISFKQQLQQAFQQAPTKQVAPASIFPSGAVQNQKIEPTPPVQGESPLDAMQQAFNFAQQSQIAEEPPVIESPQKVLEGEKRTPLNERIRWIDYLRTPWRVFERMGIKANYLELLKGYTAYTLELPKNIDKITAWSKQVSKESNERIFRSLDGEKIDLTPEEAKVAGEIKSWLAQWADRLGMKADERISSYITHIFPLGSKGEIPEELAYIINKKIPGAVYDPFLLQRQGAEGYLKDTWKALDAYVKRATRKVNMDPALASLKEASAKLTDTSQLNYLNRYVGAVNLRPTELDTSIDNHIKEKFGYMFGVRPTASLTRQARQMVARAKIGGSITSFAKNLTQGVNTFSELGTRYTTRGYIDLVKFGGKELEENGVLTAPFLEDQTYSAIKKFAERFDKVLFLNMNASELVNRGAAYYGAKAKYLNGDVTPKEISKALGKEVPKDYTPNMEDAIAYGKFVSAKTQFLFGPLDTPVALNSDIAKTLAQFQTFGLKQTEFIHTMYSEKEWLKLFRYILSSTLMFSLIGGAFGMKWDDSFKTLRWGMPPVLQFIADIWGDLWGTPDEYGKVPSGSARLRDAGTSFLTNVVPGGAQLKRSIEGFQAVNAGKSRSAGGSFQYGIEKTPMNYIKGTLFGKANLPAAKAYYDKKAGKKTSTHNRYDTI